MADAPKGQSCESCRYWYDEIFAEDSELAQCRRFPPVADRERKYEDLWPLTAYAMWCGEWAPNTPVDSVSSATASRPVS